MSEPERILELTKAVHDVATDKIRLIKQVTGTTRILSLNALIEATRAGEVGRGFAVVANEVKNVSDSINTITQAMEGELSSSIDDLMSVGQTMVQQLRGSRLTDLALNMIEIIDRNLYERSCDVRWWATDSAVVDCLANDGHESAAFACKRLGVILDSYTVYLDLWIADASGRVIANGRPDRYPRAIGTNVAGEQWFKDAMASRDGSEYSVADISVNAALNNSLVATYAAAIRKGGELHGETLGALGIFFDWQPQADSVVKGVRLRPDEKASTRCLLLDGNYRVIASSDGTGILTETVPLDTRHGIAASYLDDRGSVIGYSETPGYETYEGLGWYGVIIQRPRDGAPLPSAR
ncbi:chemotaxis protein [Paramagnetospirillum kuznetsovii]|uniref:Chemotaxis protein n=1 Tax=Paramagnetospirillum kuznetsovii TaxID=2053833 RepID=A0A364P2L1_9PROT|nr:methyl-accepting chemotaxis protein [Paramagnetospirillum kuznetsovii]RAU23526.1 chemotaxis protein [Paramagnetospirillum kuznetsovii]